MDERVVFVGWGRAVPGRERQAERLVREATASWAALRDDGAIHSVNKASSPSVPGDLCGYLMLRGSAEVIGSISAELALFTLQADLALEDVEVVLGSGTDSLAALADAWHRQMGECEAAA